MDEEEFAHQIIDEDTADRGSIKPEDTQTCSHTAFRELFSSFPHLPWYRMGVPEREALRQKRVPTTQSDCSLIPQASRFPKMTVNSHSDKTGS